MAEKTELLEEDEKVVEIELEKSRKKKMWSGGP